MIVRRKMPFSSVMASVASLIGYGGLLAPRLPLPMAMLIAFS
jgi:hypothetical protein